MWVLPKHAAELTVEGLNRPDSPEIHSEDCQSTRLFIGELRYSYTEEYAR